MKGTNASNKQHINARKGANGGRQMQKAKQESTRFVLVVVPKITHFPYF